MRTRYTLIMYKDDMGSFKQPGCVDAEDALWHINSARDHDGLPPIDLDDLRSALSNRRKTGGGFWAILTPEHKPTCAETMRAIPPEF